MWHVYIILCSDDSLYTGVTTDIPRRVLAHNQKSGGSYTCIRTPVTLIYQESHPTQSAALQREAQIKRWSRSRAKKIAASKEGFPLCNITARPHVCHLGDEIGHREYLTDLK